MKTTREEARLLTKELKKIEAKERKLFHGKKSSSEEDGISGKIRQKIPDKALTALESAFEKGFFFLFEKGDGVIEKTGNFTRLRNRYEEYEESLDRMIHPSTLKAVDQSAQGIIFSNKGLTTAEGTALGIFGIGLPDIPVFLGMLLQTSYQIAACYGIDYRKPEEKKYILSLLKTAFSTGEEQEFFSEECDSIGKIIDDYQPMDTELTSHDISHVSNILAGNMLVAKFIQGMTFVGVLGGPLNLRLIHKVSKVAKIKYKKRFLYRLLVK